MCMCIRANNGLWPGMNVSCFLIEVVLLGLEAEACIFVTGDPRWP